MKKSGFTLIELLVVIAIIGLLAAIVTASLNAARKGAADAAVKETMNNMVTQAEMYYNTNATTPLSYGGGSTACTAVFTDTIIVKQRTQIKANLAQGATETCAITADGQGWAYSVSTLRGTTTGWCVDSFGFAGKGSINSSTRQCN